MALGDRTRRFDHVTRLGLHHTPVFSAPEGAGQTFRKGAPLVISGATVVEATSPAIGASLGFGIAAQPASGITGRSVEVVPMVDHLVYEGNLEDTTFNTNQGDYPLAAADLFRNGSRLTADTLVMVAVGNNGRLLVNQGPSILSVV